MIFIQIEIVSLIISCTNSKKKIENNFYVEFEWFEKNHMVVAH